MKWTMQHLPRAPEAEGGAGGGDAAAVAAAAAAAALAAKPWYEGKADAETVGHWDNKGWKKDDPINVAIEATKQARELQKHFGVPPEQLLKLPTKPDDEAGWKAVRQRLGMPAEPKDYDFSAVKRADGSDPDPALADAMRAALHRAGVSKDAAPEVAKSVIKSIDDAALAQANEHSARILAEKAALQKEWGTNFDFNRLTAIQGAKRLGIDGEAVNAIERAIGGAKAMEAFRKIGAGTTEDTFVDTSHTGNPTTRNGATARKAELESDPAWVKRYLAGEVTARREMDNLIALTTGEAA